MPPSLTMVKYLHSFRFLRCRFCKCLVLAIVFFFLHCIIVFPSYCVFALSSNKLVFTASTLNYPVGLKCNTAYQACRPGNLSDIENLANLSALRTWHSSKPRPSSSITLVTQLSACRLERLSSQCEIYSSVIAAAVYVSVNSSSGTTSMLGVPRTVFEFESELSEWYKQTEGKGQCVLDMVVLIEYIDEPKMAMSQNPRQEESLYPFNALRNQALALSSTPVVLLLDADFMPSPTIIAEYRSVSGRQRINRLLENRGALVLPTLQTSKKGPMADKLAKQAALEHRRQICCSGSSEKTRA